ncbi:unnamed protein product [Hyaloperonospora brassicae]|uniref:FYVE-type domain-containing protein n=1 Tax=Hyaloperonospora brassicae TaxID=162125 RepID=A0AAV0UR84_HYABA|nr:unnamed protein product [Hyaloperonospora brassicae]
MAARRGLSSSRAPTTAPSASASSLTSSSSSSPLASYAAASASARTWTPLRDNHFHPPPLSARERAYLVRKSCEAAQELVERARSAGGPIAWRHVEKHNDVQIYAGSPRATTATTAAAGGAAATAGSMCGVTSVPGTVAEVASLFELGSTRQMKEFARAHREWFYDGVVLHVMAARTSDKPLHQVTAKWMVAQMPPGLPHRDFCFLECQDKFVDARGRKGWVLGQHSIKLPGCDDLKREFGLVRGSLYHSGFVVVESEERPGHVDVIHLVQLNLKERTPVPLSVLRTRVLFVTQVRNMLRSKRLNEQRYRSDLELVPKKYRSKCAVCKDSFSLLLLRKLNCRKCGDVVCAACSKEFPIENCSFAASNGGDEVRKLRICMHCFQVITNAPKPTSALVQPAHSSTISMSFLGVDDADRHLASRSGGRYNGREGEPPKIFLQSMRHEKPSRQRLSSTLHMSGFRSDVPHSASRHMMRGEPDMELYSRSQHRHQQQREYGRSHNHPESQRMRPSDFRPSQSLSLDDPITRGEDRYTMDMPGSVAAPSFTSVFDHSATDARHSPLHGFTSGSSSDLLVEMSSNNTRNFSRLQELSSRERLERLQREDNMARSNTDHRMPDAYMSALQQASRDKHEFDVPTPIYQAPLSDFGSYRATLDDESVAPPVFGPFDSTLDVVAGPPLLDVDALRITEPSVSIELTSLSPAARPPTTHQRDDNELLRLRERKAERRRESTSSDSSAISIDIDTYEGTSHLATVPSIPEQQKLRGEQYQMHVAGNVKPKVVVGSRTSASHGNRMNVACTHDTDEDSDTSMGASDDEEEGQTSVDCTPVSIPAPPHRLLDDNAEETKAQEYSETLALPPPSPSAHGMTRTTLERPSIAASSASWSLVDQSSAAVARKEGAAKKKLQTNTEAVKDTCIDHGYQLGRLKADDRTNGEVLGVHVSPKHSGVQIAGEKQRVRGLRDEANDDGLVSRERRLMGAENAVVSDTSGGDMNYLDAGQRHQSDGQATTTFCGPSSSSPELSDGMAAASNTAVDASSTAAGNAEGALPLPECTPRSLKKERTETSALSRHVHAYTSREDGVVLDNVGSYERSPSLNEDDGDAHRFGQKGLSDMSSVTSTSGAETVDHFVTGGSVASFAAEDIAEDLVTVGVNISTSLSVHDEQAFMSVMPSIETQRSGDNVSETDLSVTRRTSVSSLSSTSARDGSISSMGLCITAPNESSAPSSTDNVLPVISSDCTQTTEQDGKQDHEIAAREAHVLTTASTTSGQSSDCYALDNFQPNFPASFDAQ